MTTLIVLSSMGINIAPLLAGASIFGLAIGFGSQKLVSDVISSRRRKATRAWPGAA
jgi:small-conductance mechanosensitive channel